MICVTSRITENNSGFKAKAIQRFIYEYEQGRGQLDMSKIAVKKIRFGRFMDKEEESPLFLDGIFSIFIVLDVPLFM